MYGDRRRNAGRRKSIVYDIPTEKNQPFVCI